MPQHHRFPEHKNIHWAPIYWSTFCILVLLLAVAIVSLLEMK